MAEERDRQVNGGRRNSGVPPDEASTVQEERIVRDDEVEATRTGIEQARATSSVRDTDSRAAEPTGRNPILPLAVAGGIALLLLVRSQLGGRRSRSVIFDLKKGRVRSS